MKFLMMGAVAAALAFAGSASAAVTATSGFAFGSSSAVPVLTFEGSGLGTTVGSSTTTQGGLTLAGLGSSGVYNTGVFDTSPSGVAARPAGDGTANYYAVLGGGSATLTGAPLSNATGLSLFVGSIDDYNSVTFNFTGGGSQTINGLGFGAPSVANGNQSDLATNHYVNFAFNGAKVNSVTFASTTNSFEFDNVAVSAAPEPGVWAMMFVGVGMLGGALRFSRRRTGFALAA